LDLWTSPIDDFDMDLIFVFRSCWTDMCSDIGLSLHMSGVLMSCRNYSLSIGKHWQKQYKFMRSLYKHFQSYIWLTSVVLSPLALVIKQCVYMCSTQH
jgi:hypothetical protein